MEPAPADDETTSSPQLTRLDSRPVWESFAKFHENVPIFGIITVRKVF